MTTEEIASEAGVSRRTFANYYPNKHAAVVDGFLYTLGVPILRPGETFHLEILPTTFTDLITMVEAFALEVFSDSTRVRHIQEFATMTQAHPGVEPYLHALFHDFENSDVHEILEQRFGRAKVSIFLGSVLGSLGGIIRLLLGPVVLPQPNGTTASLPVLSEIDFKAALNHIDEAFTFLRHGFIDPRQDAPHA